MGCSIVKNAFRKNCPVHCAIGHSCWSIPQILHCPSALTGETATGIFRSSNPHVTQRWWAKSSVESELVAWEEGGAIVH